MRIILVAIALAGLVFSGCGRKGPPLPPLEQPAASESETETQPLPEPVPTPEQKDSEKPPAVPPYP